MNYSFVSLLPGALETGACVGAGKQNRYRGCSVLFGVVSGVSSGVGVLLRCECILGMWVGLGWVGLMVGLYGRMEGLCGGRLGCM